MNTKKGFTQVIAILILAGIAVLTGGIYYLQQGIEQKTEKEVDLSSKQVLSESGEIPLNNEEEIISEEQKSIVREIDVVETINKKSDPVDTTQNIPVVEIQTQNISSEDIETNEAPLVEIVAVDEMDTQTGFPDEEKIASDDICANALGNGDKIISGPLETDEQDRDNPFHSLTVHPNDPNYILVGTERNGFLRSTDGGVSWERLRYGLRHSGGRYPEIYDIAIANTAPRIIYAATVGSPGPLTRTGATSGVYKSVDGGETWVRKNCGIVDNGGRTTGVFIDPVNPNHVFIAISGGETSYYTHNQPAGIYIDGGIYETTNGGDTWGRLSVAPNDKKNSVRWFRRPASNNVEFYLSGITSDDDLDIGLVKTTNSGITWKQFAPSIKNSMVGSFDISADGKIFYVLSDDFKIYKSADSGVTWASNQIFTSGYTITVSPADGQRVLYGQIDGLYLSTDGLYSVNKVVNLDENKGRIADVVFAPSNPDVVYMITEGYVIYKSMNRGATFTNMGNLREDVLNKDL